MSSHVAFTAERKRQLVHLLVEAFESDIQQREEELLDVLTRPAPNPGAPHFNPREPELRMDISNLMENLKTLRKTGDAIPGVPRPVVGEFSIVQTRQAEQDTWYFITPCEYYFERAVQQGGMRILACHRAHFLIGTQRGHTYGSGGHWNTHTGEIYEEPLTHHVVDIF